MAADVKKNCIIKNRRCLKCLSGDHFAKNCQSKVTCKKCSKGHLTVLCWNSSVKDKDCKSVEKPQVNDKFEDKSKSAALFSDVRNSNSVYLQTLIARICIDGQNPKKLRILCDTGSQLSYITVRCAAKLKLVPVGQKHLSQKLFGGVNTPMVAHNLYNIVLSPLQGVDVKFPVTVLEQETICSNVSTYKDVAFLEELRRQKIVLTDIEGRWDEIDLLLGADALGSLLTGNVYHTSQGPMAVETALGWTLLGSAGQVKCNTVFSTMCMFTQLWDLDLIGISDGIDVDHKKLQVEKAVELHKKGLSTLSDGRYEVPLLWTDDNVNLLENREVALRRLKSMTGKLNSTTFKLYDNVLKDWENSGIIEENVDLSKSGHYLPHRPVFKESNTTKIRPVFDGSCKDSFGNSLNACLLKGPNLIGVVPDFLTRFRVGRIGVKADIRKAFLMISVREEDRNFLKFLWWKNEECTELRELRHCRVVFGLSCSSYLLCATIKHHLHSPTIPSELKDTASLLASCMYVDDCLHSVDNVVELKKFREEATAVMAHGKFELSSWEFTQITDKEENITSVLGLRWNTGDDTLSCFMEKIMALCENKLLTKRLLLSVAQSCFDPLGILSPVVLKLKIMMQSAWVAKLTWDSSLPNELEADFKEWLRQVPLLNSYKIPRYLSVSRESSVTIHTFVDASHKAYACCVFIRSEVKEVIDVQLIQARARVAPLKNSETTSTPRLELLAALIGSRLYRSVVDACCWKNEEAYFWSDSSVVIHWLKKHDAKNIFVSNRIREIKEKTVGGEWRHLPSELNAADLPSRSCSATELIESKWHEGPDWLKGPVDTWPKNYDLIYREKSVVVLAVDETNKQTEADFVSKFSKYTMIVNMVAWILRFKHNVTQPMTKISGCLDIKEIEAAETRLFLLVQNEYDVEGQMCKSGQQVGLFRDCNGLLKLKSRLVLGDFPDNFAKPVVLPRNSILVRRLVEDIHRRYKHCGVQTTMTYLKEKYFVPQARRLVKSVVAECIICKRFRAMSGQQPPGPLPPERTNRGAAFEATGVDLLGPLYLREEVKIWVALFTCAVYRAIHLEVVTSLSSECFVLALRRFIARRGRILTLFSDNGTNFRKTNSSMAGLDWTYIMEYTKIKRINCLNGRYVYIGKLREQLRNRFRNEYQGMLVDRGRKLKPRSINVGDIVLVHSDEKRVMWPLGRVIEVMLGRDGIARTARVRTEKGELIRPIQRLFSLEVVDEAEGQETAKDSDQESLDRQLNKETLTDDEAVEDGQPQRKVVTRVGKVIRPASKLDL